MSDLAREFQYAWRRLRRAPAFTVTSLVVLGIGLGATTTMFSIVNAVLLRPLPFPNSTQLVDVSHTATISGLQTLAQSDATFLLYQRHNAVFDNIGVSRPADVSIALRRRRRVGEPERVLGAGVSASWLPTLQISPARGRAFTADDDRPGAPRVVVLSDDDLASEVRRRSVDHRQIGDRQRIAATGRRHHAAVVPVSVGVDAGLVSAADRSGARRRRQLQLQRGGATQTRRHARGRGRRSRPLAPAPPRRISRPTFRGRCSRRSI